MTATWPNTAPPRLVILAAGASSRLGQPKALAQLPRGTPLDRILKAWPDSSQPALVVTGAHHCEISQALHDAHSKAQVLHNTDWDRGRTGSLQAAISAIPARDLVIVPVDCPRIPRAVFEALICHWASAGAPALGWCAPFYSEAESGKNCYGHPILIGRGLLAMASAMPADAPLRELRKSAKPLLGVKVTHPEILEDLDTPRDLGELIREDLQSP